MRDAHRCVRVVGHLEHVVLLAVLLCTLHKAWAYLSEICEWSRGASVRARIHSVRDHSRRTAASKNVEEGRLPDIRHTDNAHCQVVGRLAEHDLLLDDLLLGRHLGFDAGGGGCAKQVQETLS